MPPSSLAMVSVSRQRFPNRDLPLGEIGNEDALLGLAVQPPLHPL